MARLPRLVIPGCPHHIVLRSHNAQPAFLDEIDRQAWLSALQESASLTQVAVHAYALLDDRVHLLVTPPAADGMSKLMQSIGRRYGAGFNRRHGRSGSLWEGRFRAGVVEPERHLIDVCVFIESCAVQQGLAASAQQWPWSSHAHHVGQRIDPVIVDHAAYWALGNTPFDRQAAYRAAFEQGLASSLHGHIGSTAEKGWALGSAAFIASLAKRTDRPLSPRPRGRPRGTGSRQGDRSSMSPINESSQSKIE